mgnify:FL=1
MENKKRKFTPEEKLSLLQEAEREGAAVTCRKYNISHSLISYWKKKYLGQGLHGLKAAYKRVDPAVRALENENEQLKKIIAKQTIELEFKTELLKIAGIDPSKKKKW